MTITASIDNDIEGDLSSLPYFDGDEFNQNEYTRLIISHLSKDKDDHVKFASERIHDLIKQENGLGLRNNRMMWFANIEGFLWLSFAAAMKEKVGWENGFWLMILIPIVGILVCLSAISAILDADHAVKLLLKKWRTIQQHSPNSPYAVIPVLGASYNELEHDRISIPRWHFALYLLIGWVCGLIGVVVTKNGLA